jgi:hypothetical protein
MASRRTRNSVALAIQGMELGLAVPQVVAHRLLRIVAAGSRPSAHHWREFWLMGTEKIAAANESWNAMLLEVFRANLEFALSFNPYLWLRVTRTMRSSKAAARHIERAALAVLTKGVAPVHGRAVANARRLRRTS